MELVPVRQTVVLKVDFDLVVHLVVDVFAAGTSDQTDDTEGHGDHCDDTVKVNNEYFRGSIRYL